MKLIDWVMRGLNEERLHVISTCEKCVHNSGCDIQDWNNSRADVEPKDEFGCIHWERKE